MPVSKNKLLQPNFKLYFLHPKFLPTWLGVFILYTISWLPYKLQLGLGRLIGRLLLKVGKSRRIVAETNIRLCFPQMTDADIAQMVRKNFENTGIALLETGMGWWWPDWRGKSKVKVKGLEHIEQARAQGKGVLMLAMHYLSAEISCRGMGCANPTVVFYRPHNNPLMEYFQHRGRGRSNKYMLGKRDVKGLIKALHDGESCIYLPDQDYGAKRSLFVPFFAVKDTATTTGTLIFARQPNTVSCMVVPTRNEDGSGYTIEIMPPLEQFPTDNDEQDLITVNQALEHAILRQPEQYMWLHRRFKTRPEGVESVYNR